MGEANLNLLGKFRPWQAKHRQCADMPTEKGKKGSDGDEA